MNSSQDNAKSQEAQELDVFDLEFERGKSLREAEFNYQYSLHSDFCRGGHIIGYIAQRETEDIIERQQRAAENL